MANKDAEEQQSTWTDWLRERLKQRQVSMAKLSVAMGRERSFLQQVLTQKKRRQFTMSDLERAAPLLGVPMVTLVEKSYGIDIEKLLGDASAVKQRTRSAIEAR
jgi:transcriptional regulator with XRE-family HTH domain